MLGNIWSAWGIGIPVNIDVTKYIGVIMFVNSVTKEYALIKILIFTLMIIVIR